MTKDIRNIDVLSAPKNLKNKYCNSWKFEHNDVTNAKKVWRYFLTKSSDNSNSLLRAQFITKQKPNNKNRKHMNSICYDCSSISEPRWHSRSTITKTVTSYQTDMFRLCIDTNKIHHNNTENDELHCRSRPLCSGCKNFDASMGSICCFNKNCQNHSKKVYKNTSGEEFVPLARLLRMFLVLFICFSRLAFGNALLEQSSYISLVDGDVSSVNDGNVISAANHSLGTRVNLFSKLVPTRSVDSASGSLVGISNAALSMATTTRRSTSDGNYISTLTTIATPVLTTLKYLEKSPRHQQINFHHRNYELDLERDHALPTSAPNADILKSNSNPTYPNPNRHQNHERERHRHFLNSTPLPLLPNILKKNSGNSPTVPMYPGDIPLYSPPARSFFTPPLPPEYQNPFADKPTLRGSNNEGLVTNSGTYINRRPIPPPSLMPGHERIPFRPPDLAASTTGSNTSSATTTANISISKITNKFQNNQETQSESNHKHVMNTLLHNNGMATSQILYTDADKKLPTEITESSTNASTKDKLPSIINEAHTSTRKEVLPSIRRILSGEVPEVLLKQATSHSFNYNNPQSPLLISVDSNTHRNSIKIDNNLVETSATASSNINKSKTLLSSDRSDSNITNTGLKSVSNSDMETQTQTKGKISTNSNEQNLELVHQGAVVHNGNSNSTISPESHPLSEEHSTLMPNITNVKFINNNGSIIPTTSSSSSSSSSTSATVHSTWTVAWNIHVYLSVILFTVLTVYSLYKMLTYNKLTHLFSQSYFVCIHVILIFICSARIFYLCYDAYNIHSSFHIFVSEILLNLPATFLTTAFAVLILFLFLKSFNHKNNRYSALIRPLTVVVGCGVHVGLCITLHYVESYTMQNHQQQQYLYYQQQQLYRRHQQQQQFQSHQIAQQQLVNQQFSTLNFLGSLVNSNGVSLQQPNAAFVAAINSPTIPSISPPRALSLICQLIYIFICFTLGVLYLYLYRILKRILRSKSQNYIHWYQNLSYAIHITIATALLFVLLAALQIFGAISISTNRPLLAQGNTEIDWLQWSYQFSLRLIEIAVITLISWVASLKTSDGNSRSGIGGSSSTSGNGDVRLNGGGNSVFGSGAGSSSREKQTPHSNVTGFFLPCTSSSSQEQFETDYPAVCNANTNLHTYTMRTGKLIYDDSFALNSLASSGGGGGSRNGEFQLQQPTYHRPYDTNSLHSSFRQNMSDQSTLSGTGGRYRHDMNQYADYLPDSGTDHYENPNFDLHGSGSSSGLMNKNSTQKHSKTITPSATVLGTAGSGASATSQQQIILLQNDNCYSEPVHQASCYDFNNFERPDFGETESTRNIPQQNVDQWNSQHVKPMPRGIVEKQDKKMNSTLDRAVYENPDKRNSFSVQSSKSVLMNNGNNRHPSVNSFERTYFNDVRKSGTLNNIIEGSHRDRGATHGRERLSPSSRSPIGSKVSAFGEDHQIQNEENESNSVMQTNSRGGKCLIKNNHSDIMIQSSLENISNRTLQPQLKQLNSDDDMVLSGSNVEHANLINNEDGSCITNSSSTTLSADQGICSNSTNSEHRLNSKSSTQQLQNNTHSSCSASSQSTNYSNSNTSSRLQNCNQINYQQQHRQHPQNHKISNNTLVHDSAVSINSGNSSTASESATSGSMLVAELGFVRFRALDDINNAQGIGIHNASIRHQSHRALEGDVTKIM